MHGLQAYIIKQKEKRVTFLNKLGYAELSGQVREEIRRDDWEALAQRQTRGITSREADILADARKRRTRAVQMGYESLEQRFNYDHQFRRRMTPFGKTVEEMQYLDLMSMAQSPKPPRDRPQTGYNTTVDHAGWRMCFIDAENERSLPPLASQVGIRESWLIMNAGAFYSFQEFAALVDLAETREFYIITYEGVEAITGPEAEWKLRSLARRSLRTAVQTVEQKERQSAKAKARAAPGEHRASGNTEPSSSSRPTGYERRDRNRGRRMWEWYRGHWYQRDDSRERWRYWG